AIRLQASVETLEQRVEERTEQIRRLLDARSEFFAGLSHELRTPIAAILAQADLLVSDEASGAEAGRIVQASGEQLLKVVNEILDLAKAEAGRVEVEVGDVRVADVFRAIKPTFEPLAAASGVRLSVKTPRGLPAMRADNE